LNPEEVAEEMEGNFSLLTMRVDFSNQLSIGEEEKKLDAEQEVAFSSNCDICVDL
jgi:hypothetical protein